MAKHRSFDPKSLPLSDRLIIERSYLVGVGVSFRKTICGEARLYVLTRLNWELLCMRLPRLFGANQARCEKSLAMLQQELSRLSKLVPEKDSDLIEPWLHNIQDKAVEA